MIKKITLLILLFVCNFADPVARIKDITNLMGVRNNQLMGTGLVVGLSGTGDKTAITQKMVMNAMRNLGANLDDLKITPKNSAAVILTANLPPFANPGDQIDVTVSTMGDAGSLQGGILIQTPLAGADGKVYAVAQGALSLGGQTGGSKTVASIPRGAIVEREVPMQFSVDGTLHLVLRNKDFTTANRIAQSINEQYGLETSEAIDAGKIRVKIPYVFQQNPVEFVSLINAIEVQVDQKAKVVINERTGTVVFGGDVRISPVAIAHNTMMIQIGNKLNTTNSAQRIVEAKGATVQELINTLNLMGVQAKDLIAIIQEIKNAGALQGELEIM